MVQDDSDLADRLVRRRSRISILFGALFVATQVATLSGPHPAVRDPGPYQLGHIAAWLVWAAILLAALVTGGGLLRPAKVRATMNDETTRAHRLQAIVAGYCASLAAAALMYGVNLYHPLATADALRLVVTVAVGTALFSFGIQERLALGDA